MSSQDVEARIGVSMTEYRVHGSLAGIFEWVNELMQRKPAMAYGTRVHAIEWDFGSNRYVARISHANSAD